MEAFEQIDREEARARSEEQHHDLLVKLHALGEEYGDKGYDCYKSQDPKRREERIGYETAYMTVQALLEVVAGMFEEDATRGFSSETIEKLEKFVQFREVQLKLREAKFDDA